MPKHLNVCTREEIENKVRAEIAALVGTPVLVHRVVCYEGDDQIDLPLNPPVMMRVTGGESQHWTDDAETDWNDSYIDMEPMSSDPQLEGYRTFYCYGDSLSTDGRRDLATDFAKVE